MKDYDEREKKVTLTPEKIQEQIRKNLIENDLFRLKDCNSLVIGLGGTGCIWAAETRKLLNSRFDLDALDKRVKFLLFDTNSQDLDKMKGLFKDAERQALSSVEFEDYAKNFPPQIEPWVNQTFKKTYRELIHAAGQRRMGGRFYFYANSEIIKKKINDCLTDFRLTQTHNIEATHIFLMAGLSGGTGSGCFIDVAFLTRTLMPGLSNGRLIGLFELPDATIKRVGLTSAIGADEVKKLRMQNNGYCALRELDYFMRKYDGDEKEPYRFIYKKMEDPTLYRDHIFDTAFLLSDLVYDSRTGGRFLPKLVNETKADGTGIPYLERAVPEIINSFVSKPAKENGERFNLVNTAEENVTRADNRESGTLYTTAGIAKLEIPTDKILFCIIAKLFSEFSRRWDVDPGEFEKRDFYQRLELENLYSAIKSRLRSRIERLTKKDMSKAEFDLAGDLKNGVTDDFKRYLAEEDGEWSKSLAGYLRDLHKTRGPVPLINLTKYAVDEAETFFKELIGGDSISQAVEDYNKQIVKGKPGQKIKDALFNGILGKINGVFETQMKETRIAKILKYNNDIFDKTKCLFESFSGILNRVFDNDRSVTTTQKNEGITTFSWDFSNVPLADINQKIENMFRTKVRKAGEDAPAAIPANARLYKKSADGEKQAIFAYKGSAVDIDVELMGDDGKPVSETVYNSVEEISEEIIIDGKPLNGFKFDDVAQEILDIIFSYLSGEPVKEAQAKGRDEGDGTKANILDLVINRVKTLKNEIIGAGFEKLLLQSSGTGDYTSKVPDNKEDVYKEALNDFFFYSEPSFPLTGAGLMQVRSLESSIIKPKIIDIDFQKVYDEKVKLLIKRGVTYDMPGASIFLGTRVYPHLALTDYYYLSELYAARKRLKEIAPQYIPGSHLSEGDMEWNWDKIMEELYTPRSVGGGASQGAVQAAVAPTPPPFVQTSSEWYVALSGKESTPMSLDTLSALALSKELTKETKVWKDGMADWAPVGTLPELAGIFPKGPPPIAKPLLAVEWYIGVPGKDPKPFTIDALAAMAAKGELTKETKVWKESMENWSAAGTLPELDGIFPQKKGPPPLPKTNGPPPLSP
jgi:hypothetical protein